MKILRCGLYLILVAIWAAALSSDSGSVLGGISIVLMGIGSLLFIVGILRS